MRLSDMNVSARGLSKEEIQAAIDNYVEAKKGTYLPKLEEELKQIQEEIQRLEMLLDDNFDGQLFVADIDFARKILDAIKKYHPELLKDI